VSAGTRKDWILWGALGCALVSTAHAEYTLATAAHFNEYVALAVPGALDLYVVRALQQRRDVFVAVLAMVAANVTSHLIAGGVLDVRWPVIAAVGAVAPLIVWRVYSLKYTRTRKELLWGTEAGAVSAPSEYALGYVPGPVPEAGTSVPVAGQKPCQLSEPLYLPLDHECSECGAPWGTHPEVQRKRAAFGPVPDAVPADWMAAEYPETYPGTAVLAAQEDEYADKWEASAPAPLHSVPALPPEYTSGAVHSAVLEERDSEYGAPAKQYAAECAVSGTLPTVRGMRRELSIGQDRAERLLAWLESEEK